LYLSFDDMPTTSIYTLSLHDALPICQSVMKTARVTPFSRMAPRPPLHSIRFETKGERRACRHPGTGHANRARPTGVDACPGAGRSEEHTSELQSRENLVCRLLLEKKK